jgi:hypothetical protein
MESAKPESADSRARFLTIAAKRIDLIAQGLNPGCVTTTDRNCEREFQLFEKMVTFTGSTTRVNGACRRTGSSRRAAKAGVIGVVGGNALEGCRESHG